MKEVIGNRVVLYLTDEEMEALQKYAQAFEQTVEETAAQIVADTVIEELTWT